MLVIHMFKDALFYSFVSKMVSEQKFRKQHCKNTDLNAQCKNVTIHIRIYNIGGGGFCMEKQS